MLDHALDTALLAHLKAVPELGALNATHAARVESARAALADRATVIAALNATGQLHIYGYAAIGTEPTAGDARFNTKLKYRFGFGPA
jgi:hypothetical protein